MKTSPLQFAFKKDHSTVMCNFTTKEVINYYINNGSKVYACLIIDASKAFDRLRYDKLFKLMLDRGMPCIIIRSMLDIYEKQKVRTTWEGCHSEYFTVSNGIRQGGIMSPLLYTIYTAELLITRIRRRLLCVQEEWGMQMT